MICILQLWIGKMYSKRLSYLYKTVKTATASSTTNHMCAAIKVTTLGPSLQRSTTIPLECWNAGTLKRGNIGGFARSSELVQK